MDHEAMKESPIPPRIFSSTNNPNLNHLPQHYLPSHLFLATIY
jgi:hypothetical protein